jgi:hypothetical protein
MPGKISMADVVALSPGEKLRLIEEVLAGDAADDNLEALAAGHPSPVARLSSAARRCSWV